MGQYYNAVVKFGEKKDVFYHTVDKKRMMAKLMEHSYWANTFVLAIASKFWRKKGRLAWVGDYAESSDFNWNDDFEDAHSDNAKKTLKYNGFRLDGKYLINHSKKMVIELDEYYALIKDKSNEKYPMILNPLSLLTAVGNDKGCGDFHCGQGYKLVGTWAWDLIEITDDEVIEYRYSDGDWIEVGMTKKYEGYTNVTKDYLFIDNY